MIFETHCHLNDPQLINDFDDVVARAKKVGINKMIVVGWDKASSLLAIKMANDYDFIYAAIGFHPCNVFDITDQDLEELFANFNNPKVVALGEIGLDYHWYSDAKKKEIQKQFFIKQLSFADKFKKPVIIHNREAFQDCLEILKEHNPIMHGVFHCYSGSVEALKDVLELGFYIGIGGVVTFKNAIKPKEVVEKVPLDRLLVETDCPYLAPTPLRGTVNEPANIALVIDEIANLREESKKHILDVIYHNSLRLFNINDD